MLEEKEYKLTTEQKKYFCSVLLLEDMNNFDKEYPILLEGDDELLEPLFVHMMANDWIETKKSTYGVTNEGRKVLRNYIEKLYEFRSIFKVFCAIDIDTDEIGYNKFFDFDTDEQFYAHLQEDRFEDLRVAVCELKGINPLEIIFLEFVDGGEYDFEEEGWQADLVTGLIWDDLLDVANSNLHLDELGKYDEDDTLVETGKEFMVRMIKDGTELMVGLIKKQAEVDEEEDDDDDDDIEEEYVESTTENFIDEPVYNHTYYESYYDPYYISPCWGVYY
jgi:hypothetical protein